MVMNVSCHPAHLLLDVYWTDRPPTLGLPVLVEAERVRSLRAPYSEVDAHGAPFEIPVRTQYAIRVRQRRAGHLPVRAPRDGARPSRSTRRWVCTTRRRTDAVQRGRRQSSPGVRAAR